MFERIIIAGAGGQGIMLLGRVLAQAAMIDNRHVTWLPSYGAEVRGGTAHCSVVVSDEEIGSAYIEEADTLIVMNAPSLARFQGRLRKKGLLIRNTSFTRACQKNGIRCIGHPFTDIACDLGNIKVANMVALGSYLKHSGIVSVPAALQAMVFLAGEDKKGIIGINQEALDKGMRL